MGINKKQRYLRHKKVMLKKKTQRRSRYMKHKKFQHSRKKYHHDNIVKTTGKRVFLKDSKHAEKIFNIKSEDENNEFDEEYKNIIDENDDDEYDPKSPDSPTQ